MVRRTSRLPSTARLAFAFGAKTVTGLLVRRIGPKRLRGNFDEIRRGSATDQDVLGSVVVDDIIIVGTVSTDGYRILGFSSS